MIHRRNYRFHSTSGLATQAGGFTEIAAYRLMQWPVTGLTRAILPPSSCGERSRSILMTIMATYAVVCLFAASTFPDFLGDCATTVAQLDTAHRFRELLVVCALCGWGGFEWYAPCGPA